MGELIDFDEAKKKQMVNKLMEGMSAFYSNANEIANRFFDLMMANPTLAIKRFPEFIRQAKGINKCPDALCGGPNQDYFAPLYNILGMVYCDIPKEARTEGLTQIINHFDGINSRYVQWQVELITNPWLVSDIYVNRSLYWPGYEAQAKFVSECKDPDSLKEGMKRFNPFFLAFPMLKPKYSSLKLRSRFYSEFPDLIDKTLDAVAAMLSVESRYFGIKDETGFEEEFKKDISRFDTLLHERIRKKVDEEKWILLPNSQFIESLRYGGWNWDGTKIEKH